MNAETLKPFLDQAAAAFPKQRVRIRIGLETHDDGSFASEEVPNFLWLIEVSKHIFWGGTFEACLSSAKAGFEEKQKQRIEELKSELSSIEV